jgi:F420H(2)-dependent quinone reductase
MRIILDTRRAMVDFLKLADRSWPVLGPLMRGHAWIYRTTGGRIGGDLPGLPRLLLLDHLGARTGRKRTTPLVYMPDGEAFVVVASKGGHPQNPAWVHNLRANPETEVQIGSRRVAVRAREAEAEERRRLWSKAVAYNRVWGNYQQRTQRTIPLFVLEPRAQPRD